MNNTPPPTNNSPNLNTKQSCAACRHCRKKCESDCILAPYFPSDRQQQFINAYKLFGVGNLIKIFKNLDQSQRHNAMVSVIYTSEARARDPVGGCYTIIQELKRQIIDYKTQLNSVNSQLELYRAQAVNDRVVINGPDQLNLAVLNLHQELEEMPNDWLSISLQQLQESTSFGNNACEPFLDLTLHREDDGINHHSPFTFEDDDIDTIVPSNNDILARRQNHDS